MKVGPNGRDVGEARRLHEAGHEIDVGAESPQIGASFFLDSPPLIRYKVPMLIPIGAKVVIKSTVRYTQGDVAATKGREGLVVRHVLDCGGTAKDPMYYVLFLDDLKIDGFWREELIHKRS